MKKAIICVLLIFALALTGCESSENTENESELSEYSNSVYLYIDDETGVEYLIFNSIYGGGMCPRFNADGSLRVSENNTNLKEGNDNAGSNIAKAGN